MERVPDFPGIVRITMMGLFAWRQAQAQDIASKLEELADQLRDPGFRASFGKLEEVVATIDGFNK